MAKQNCIELGVNVEFEACDIHLKSINKKFDLIKDSSFFHCIIFDDERINLFQPIKKGLRLDGFFFMHTMIQSKDMSLMLSQKHLILEDEILWSTGRDEWNMEWREVAGERVFAHRRIKTQKSLEAELYDNGFEIMSKEIKYNDGHPSVFIVGLRY